MRAAPAALALLAVMATSQPARAQLDPHQHHHMPEPTPALDGSAAAQPAAPSPHDSLHAHGVGPAGSTYDLRWLDAMVLHHSGALRMSEFMFNIGSPGVGALANAIWDEQSREIKAMGQWRRAWYPEAPAYPLMLKPGGDPDAMSGLTRMPASRVEAMRMSGSTPSRDKRVSWFLEGMIAHHGGALAMAHDALQQSRNPTIRRLAREIIVAQRREMLELQRMLRHDGLDQPEYHRFDALFSF